MSWRPAFMRDQAPDPAAIEAEAERAKQTADLRRRLRDARVLADLTLADVERDTRINRIYLEAIEDGRFGDIPAPIYARGFVRSYARYLGLDPEESVAAMPDLPPPLGLEPMAGLRRNVTPVLPDINLPVAGAIAAAALVLALVAYLVLPGLGGGDGVDLPADGSTPTATSSSGTDGTDGAGTPAATDTSDGSAGTPNATATVPPFDEGTTPDFSGVRRAEAESVLDTLDVTPLFVESTSEAPAGLVFDQNPAAGTNLEPGDVITLFISTGP